MRIGFSGVSSTGKTTLAKIIAEHYGVPLLDEGMKHAYERFRAEWGHDAPKFEHMPDFQKIVFQTDMIDHRCRKELEMDSFVGDGTPLDIMAFLLEWSTRYKATGDDLNYNKCIDKYQLMLCAMLHRYEVIIRCPFGVIPIEDDNRRFSNHKFLEKMSWVLDGITHKHTGTPSPKVFTLQTSLLEDRVSEIHEILKLSALVL